MAKQIIPVFFACDDNFVKFTIVAITSLKENASRDYDYDIHILYTKMSREMEKATLDLAEDGFRISFDDVSYYLKQTAYKMPVRDYYSKTTYFRLFISEMFPQYDKAIYLDSDMVIRGDISELYNHDLGDNYVGACHEQAMMQVDEFGTYVEQCIGLDRNWYFNAGMLLINCRQFRAQKVLDQFIHLLHEYDFVVTQDEDYLNFICKDHILWIENYWNFEVIFKYDYRPEEIKLLHYLMVGKPWHYDDCPYKEFFWEYAKKTSVYDSIYSDLVNYPESSKIRDAEGARRLKETAVAETNRSDNFLRRRQKLRKLNDNTIGYDPEKANRNRLEIVEKIREYERLCLFDKDVEDDIPGRPIEPGEVDYMRRKLSSRIAAKFAFRACRKFLKKLIKSNQLYIDGVEGVENLECINSGAVITCNHFNAFDSFAIQSVHDELLRKGNKGRFFRVISEANYTSYPGFYGYIMKRCNTLPLSSNHRTMNEFMNSTQKLLQEGNYVLIYPEQSMWWNYRKPKPLKKGAYTFAAKAKVPVIPVFITLKDSDVLDNDGFYAQHYTLHICKPVFPKEEYSRQDNVQYMMNENYKEWQEVYEKFYGIPLSYDVVE